MAVLKQVDALVHDGTDSLKLQTSSPTGFEYTQVYSEVNCNAPLGPYSAITVPALYPEFDSQAGAVGLPPRPTDFGDEDYLYPYLAKNEYVRLKLLWYHTRDLSEDTELLQNLQKKADLIRSIVGWEHAIVGILDAHAFRRLATSNLDLAVLPRRESTCSHTIQGGDAGAVLAISNLAEDWRFKNSPHVAKGGLRSYAGTPIVCRTATGEPGAIGSLCVASSSPGRVLTKSQREVLVGFADMVAAEFTSRSQLRRREHQQQMSDLLSKAAADPQLTADQVLQLLEQVYPRCTVAVCNVSKDAVTIDSQTSRRVHLSDIRGGLWEDTATIQMRITDQNHNPRATGEIVRAVVGPCYNYPETKALVIATSDMYLVFDDIDAWFTDRCSSLLIRLAHQQALEEARQAKERFLRGITHQLRTPIHGMLGSLELLAEELQQSLAVDAPVSPDLARTVTKMEQLAVSPMKVESIEAAAYIRAIRNSGRELMSTVNNMIALTRWESMIGSVQTSVPRDLGNIEERILDEAVKYVAESDLDRLCILFDNQLPQCTTTSLLDIDMLVQALSLLMANAMQYTPRGCISVVIRTDETSEKLVFDIRDSGRGIQESNVKRIFEPFEKEDEHEKGAGLGLTIASRVAAAMSGTVTLVSTSASGSHFRAEFSQLGLACNLSNARDCVRTAPKELSKFHFLPADHRTLTVERFEGYLIGQNLQTAECDDADFVVVCHSWQPDTFRRNIASANGLACPAVCLLPNGEDLEHLRRDHPHIEFVSGPFTTTKLQEVLRIMARRVASGKLKTSQQLGSTHPGALSTTLDGAVVETGPQQSLSINTRKRLPRALLVDDNAINLRIVKLYCTKRALPFRTAVDGYEAVAEYEAALAADEGIDIILLDLQMPRCDGIEACTTIRRIEKERNLPRCIIFIVTGQDGPRDRERATQAGADQYYVKPLSLKSLDRSIGAYFDLSV